MSRELVESILNGDYVSANELFKQNMSNIQERKLYESKRMMQAEVFGGKTTAQAEKEIRARGMTPRRASDVYQDPRSIKIPKIGEKKPESKRKAPPKLKKDTRPGVIKRNVNTLMGRSPGYVKPETPESEKGGRIGKGVRAVGKGVGKAWGVWSNVLRAGQSGNLEE